MRFVALYGGPLDGACVPATPIEAYVRQGVTRILFRERTGAPPPKWGNVIRTTVAMTHRECGP